MLDDFFTRAIIAGIGVALAGIVRDILVASPNVAGLQPSTPYNVVFTVEMVFLLVAIIIAIPLVVRRKPFHSGPTAAMPSAATSQPNPVEAP